MNSRRGVVHPGQLHLQARERTVSWPSCRGSSAGLDEVGRWPPAWRPSRAGARGARARGATINRPPSAITGDCARDRTRVRSRTRASPHVPKVACTSRAHDAALLATRWRSGRRLRLRLPRSRSSTTPVWIVRAHLQHAASGTGGAGPHLAWARFVAGPTAPGPGTATPAPRAELRRRAHELFDLLAFAPPLSFEPSVPWNCSLHGTTSPHPVTALLLEFALSCGTDD